MTILSTIGHKSSAITDQPVILVVANFGRESGLQAAITANPCRSDPARSLDSLPESELLNAAGLQPKKPPRVAVDTGWLFLSAGHFRQ